LNLRFEVKGKSEMDVILRREAGRLRPRLKVRLKLRLRLRLRRKGMRNWGGIPSAF
jgi:hypothetical protein